MKSSDENRSKYVRKRNVLVRPYIFNALGQTNIVNLLLWNKQFLITKFSNPVGLNDFLKIQLENILQVKKILKF